VLVASIKNYFPHRDIKSPGIPNKLIQFRRKLFLRKIPIFLQFFPVIMKSTGKFLLLTQSTNYVHLTTRNLHKVEIRSPSTASKGDDTMTIKTEN